MRDCKLKIEDKTWHWLVKKLGPNRLIVFIYVLLESNEKGDLITSIRELSRNCGQSFWTVRYFVENPINRTYTAQPTAQKKIEIHIENIAQFVEGLQPTAQPTAQLPHSLKKGPSFPFPSHSPISINPKEKKFGVTNVTPVAQEPQLYDFRTMQSRNGNGKRPKTDLQKVVKAWKITSGHEDDEGWDKINYTRCSKSAKSLLDYFENWELAADCIEEVFAEFTSKGFTVTLETIVKHASDWRLKKEKKVHGVLFVQGNGGR